MNQTSTTPEGFRNLRVLIPEDLHWRLRELAHQSRMSFHKYILSWLSEASSLKRDAGPPDRRSVPADPQAEASGPGPLRGHAPSPHLDDDILPPNPTDPPFQPAGEKAGLMDSSPPPGSGRRASSVPVLSPQAGVRR